MPTQRLLDAAPSQEGEAISCTSQLRCAFSIKDSLFVDNNTTTLLQLSKRFIAKSQSMEDRSTLVSYMLDTLKSANLKPLTCEVMTAVQSVEDSDLVMGESAMI